MELTLTVNGVQRTIDAAPHATLLQVLRDDLGLTGTKEGCDEGECGACTVIIDGDAVDSCIVAAHSAAGSAVETVEGLANGSDELTPLQRAFAQGGGVQCGFCTPGFLMTLTAYLRENPHPTEAEVREAIAGNICRCTGYSQIVEAALVAAAEAA